MSNPLSDLKVAKSFGLLGGCKVKIEKGYIEIKGAAMNARARVPIEAVEYAIVQRSMKGTLVANQPQLVLIGKGAELGHADLALLKRKAGEQAAEWINDLLGQHRPKGPTVEAATVGGVAEQLRELADLHAQGVVTDGEFDTKKAELLARM